MNDATLTYGTWYSDTAREPAMEEAHKPLWRHFIDVVPETNLLNRDVLDFGCNRGGFLRLLYAVRPFRRGLGVDIAKDSIAAARELAGNAPLKFEVAADLNAWASQFDIAFSYEVIYLLPDIQAHASQVYAALREGASYYAVTGCHTASPLWPAFRREVSATSQAPVQDRSPEDYAAAFKEAGFEVSVRRFGYQGFVPLPKNQNYYKTLMEAIDYAADHKLLFRFTRPRSD
jgi:SAM-dependent methyltransferase